jgi:UDP-N-acetylmuramoyl-tripeptide--D-alanyl-D-alanine ligase
VNAAGVVAAAFAAGVDPKLALDVLARLEPVAGRGARFEAALAGARTITVIDESYNANPASMAAALTSLRASTPGPGGRRIALLGEMLELGPDSPSLHAALAGPIEDAGADLVIVVGEGANPLAEALAGRVEVVRVREAGAAGELLHAQAGDGDVVLIKGSNASGVHKVAASLKDGAATVARI